jgi:mannosyltransferase
MITLRSRFQSIDLDSRIQYVFLALITLLAIFLRFYKLGAWSFWIDEIFTLNSIPWLSEWPLPRLPIYLVLIRAALDIFGTSEWSARFVPALVGVLTVPALYFPIRWIMGTGVALLSMLLLALSPWHIYWSQNARFYTLLLLFYTLGLLLFYIGFEKGKKSILILATIFLILAVRERIFSFFFVPVLVTYFAMIFATSLNKSSFRIKASRNSIISTSNLKFSAKGLLPFALLALPFMLYSLYDLFRVVIWEQPSYIAVFFTTFFDVPNIHPVRLSLAIIYRIGLGPIVLGVAGGLYLVFQKDKKGLFFLTGALLPPILLILMANIMFTLDRYIFFTLPFWLILSAVAFQALYRNLKHDAKLLSTGLLAILIFSFVSQDVLYFQHQNGERPDWRSAFSEVGRRKNQTDLVTSTRPEIGVYYMGEAVRGVNSLDPQKISQSEQRVWIVIDDDSGWVRPNLYRWILDHARLVDVVEVYIPGKSLSIWIYLYDPVENKYPITPTEDPYQKLSHLSRFRVLSLVGRN